MQIENTLKVGSLLVSAVAAVAYFGHGYLFPNKVIDQAELVIRDFPVPGQNSRAEVRVLQITRTGSSYSLGQRLLFPATQAQIRLPDGRWVACGRDCISTYRAHKS